ncbi:cytochrome P450 6k1-like [Chelonus insularis]|uniref:cytochrome P450 6k1-like n=1 Tax=Chelonus insularis TaxID=460826 RepID=UPI00158ED16E|nr:cytochrome P450 6k1-like [Chelonus insularis]
MAFFTKYLVFDMFIGLVSLFFLAYLYMTRKFKYWKKQGITEVTPIPFVGNFGACLIAKKSAGRWIQDIYEWGSGLPYVGLYIFDKPALLFRDPELVKNVLVRDFNYFQDRYARASPHDRLGDANLFLLKNPAWKLVRTKLTPIYTSGRLKKMFELMVEIGNDLSTHMENLHLEGEGKTLEMKELAAKFTTDMIATTAFGVKANSLNDPNAEFRQCGRKIFETSLYRNFELTAIFFAPSLVKPLNLQFMSKEGADFLRNTMSSVINERERSGFKRNDLIDLLVELKNNAKNDSAFKNLFDFSGDNLVAQAAVFFNGGFETSSSVISFTLYELALHPEIQSKLREEINDALHESDGKITYEMVMNMPYMDMCVSETLRKYPPLPFLDRVTTENYKIPNSNITLEKGTPVVISVSGLHFDSEYFPDPDKYDPERFSSENKKATKPFVYIPFGEGPHICIGMRIGLLQSKLGLIKLLSEYEFTPCNETLIPMQLTPKSVLTTALGGIYLNTKKIKAA